MTTTLPYRLDRSIFIKAAPETVFRFFTDNARWASWWGTGSHIEPRPGGRVHIRYPEGTEAGGEVVDIAPPQRLVFTYGFASGTPVPIGASRVTISLASENGGTRLSLAHELPDEASRDAHEQGWRYQLALFANVVANEVAATAAAKVDGWFGLWAEPDGTARARRLAEIAVDDVRFSDRYSLTAGAADLVPHITAARQHMPGLRLERRGDVRHCQGVVLADWAAVNAAGDERGRGTNVFVLASDGRIQSVTGFWS
jgi:uncharacterized protein YndB with AHSA1/START domain